MLDLGLSVCQKKKRQYSKRRGALDREDKEETVQRTNSPIRPDPLFKGSLGQPRGYLVTSIRFPRHTHRELGNLACAGAPCDVARSVIIHSS